VDDSHRTLAWLMSVGVAIGIGQMLSSAERLTARMLIGRAIISGGLGLAAGAALTVFPSLGLVAMVGIASVFVSLGTSAIEAMFTRIVGALKTNGGK